MLQPDGIARIKHLLVEFHDIFARHRFDIDMNEELTVQLTTKMFPRSIATLVIAIQA